MIWLQSKVEKFISEHGLKIDPVWRLHDLTAEVGELTKELLKITNYGKCQFAPTSDWEMELGDVLFSLICLANATEINLQDALNKAIHKYQTRILEKGDASSNG